MRRCVGTLIALVMVVAFANVAAAGDAANGEKLFKDKKMKCKTCHKLTEKNKVGPGLKGVTKRRSEAWLTKWLKDPQGTWVENDAETQDMKKWKKGRAAKKKTKMKIKKLADGDVADLIAFMKKNDG